MSAPTDEEKKLPYPCTVKMLQEAGTWHFRVLGLVDYADDLSSSARHLQRVILLDVNFHGWNNCYKSLETYVKQTGMNIKTVRKALRELADKEYIRLQERQGDKHLIEVLIKRFVELSHRAAAFEADRAERKAMRRNARSVSETVTKNGTGTPTKNGTPTPTKSGMGTPTKIGSPTPTKNGTQTKSTPKFNSSKSVSSELVIEAPASDIDNGSNDNSFLGNDRADDKVNPPSSDDENRSAERKEVLNQSWGTPTKNGMGCATSDTVPEDATEPQGVPGWHAWNEKRVRDAENPMKRNIEESKPLPPFRATPGMFTDALKRDAEARRRGAA